MAEQPGFFEQLIGSTVDEKSVLNQQIREDITRGGRMASLFHGLGRQAGGGLGVAAISAFSKEKGKAAEENLVASANGIQPAELRARRRIRKETADITDDGTFTARAKMAEIAARIAMEEGDGVGLARALSATQSLREEEEQFDSLQATTTAKENTQIQNGWRSDGTPVTGIQGVSEEGVPGMYTTVNGKLDFIPFDDDFSMVDPSDMVDGALPVSEIPGRIKINNGTAFITRVKGLAISANTALGKTDRILSSLVDLTKEGGVESVMSSSGGFVAGIDNLSRNVRGVISAVSGADAKKGTVQVTRLGADGQYATVTEERTFTPTKEGWEAMAADAANKFSELIKLPEGMERVSSAAQQHRANVMEMAYMAARLAEPSNRGLSDNDIKNALIRIAGSTSNPQIMMRKFLEMQLDAASELEFTLDTVRGSLGPNTTNDQIDTALLGEGYKKYSDRRAALFEKFGVVPGADGRMTFAAGSVLGTDVQPGEGTTIPEEGPFIGDMSNDDAAAALDM